MACREEFLLRPMKEADLPQVLEWRNSERVRVNMYTDHLISPEEHAKWFALTSKGPNARHLIFEQKKVPLGVVIITQIDERSRKCSWGFYLGAENAAMTTGPAMEFLALDYMFAVLSMRKICCEVFKFNNQVIKLHKKFGFVEEGHLSRHVLKNRSYEDVVCLAVFEEAWAETRKRLEKICFRG